MIHHLTRILYIQFKSFGDVLVSTAIIRALKNKYSNSIIDYYTNRVNKDLLLGNPIINRIFFPTAPPVFEDYDMIFRPYRCLQMSANWQNSDKHFMDLYAEICGVDLKGNYFPEFYNIADCKVEMNNTVLLQCKTNDDAKDWSISNFERLVKLLHDKQLKAIQIGGVEDPCILGIDLDLRGKTSFPQTANLMKRAVTTVCLDSAVQHLAVALNVSYIALYGAKDPKLTSSGIINIYHLQYCLSPEYPIGDCIKSCYMARCLKDKKCIDTILPETVMHCIGEING